jgi:hypothetical protein
VLEVFLVLFEFTGSQLLRSVRKRRPYAVIKHLGEPLVDPDSNPFLIFILHESPNVCFEEIGGDVLVLILVASTVEFEAGEKTVGE